MKVAIVHDWLNQKVGGAENVVIKLAQMHPDADIFTLVYNRKKFGSYFTGRTVHTSRLQRFPGFIKSRPKLLLPFIKKSVEKMNFDGYDLVITSSSAWVKNINVPKSAKHICYCYSPARMLWDSWPGYIHDMKLGPIGRFYVTKLVSKLRLWDYYKSRDGIKFIAISRYVQSRITKYYHQPSTLIYPPVNFSNMLNPEPSVEKQNYYLVVSVLSKYKNIDLAIRAFKKSGKKLKIVGDGPDLARLQKIAAGAGNIEFLGRVSDHDKTELLQRAKGFVFCSVEDFGITMVESIAAGTAVIALKGGGAEEIIDQSTGVFFDESSPEALDKAISILESKFKGNYRLKNSYVFDKFSEANFEKKFREAVGE